MVIRRSDMKAERRESMRGGAGAVTITNLVRPEDIPHGRLLADLSIPPGAGIGVHEHGAETEYYVIHGGRGIVVDDGVEREVGAGDVVVTGGGASHSIRNDSDQPLRLIAIIITH
jgi:mannose-6-phosphate isomerase-like protein (cupin superfamily)